MGKAEEKIKYLEKYIITAIVFIKKKLLKKKVD